MLFSVIIPTCNRPDMLALCLGRLAPGVQSLDASLYEVIVTDDGLTTVTKVMVQEQYPWAKWVEGPKRGPAANRNNGAGLAAAAWLIFTDDDCLPDHNWLNAYAAAIKQHPDCKAFEGAILPDDPVLLQKDMAECPVNEKGGCFWSANIMVEKKLFQSVGGFDERFQIAANEDQQIYTTVKKLTTVPFIKGAFVIHPVRIVPLFKKIRGLYQSEMSQILLNATQGSSFIANWADGLRVHSLAGWSNLKKNNFQRFTYNIVGLGFSIFIAPFLIIGSHHKKGI